MLADIAVTLAVLAGLIQLGRFIHHNRHRRTPYTGCTNRWSNDPRKTP